jgi:chromosome segregation ATPase
MEMSFDLLEERVKKAAELVQRLRKENKAVEEDLARARSRLEEAERRLEGLEKAHVPDRSREVEALQKDLQALRKEREEVRSRIGKLVEILDEIE